MGKFASYSAQLFKVLTSKCGGRGGFSFRNSGHHRLLNTPHLGILPTGKTLTERISSSSMLFSKKGTQFFIPTAETRVFLLSPHWKGMKKWVEGEPQNLRAGIMWAAQFRLYHIMYTPPYVCVYIVYIFQQCLWICKCGMCILSLLQLKNKLLSMEKIH